jgi:hypothetical protein
MNMLSAETIFLGDTSCGKRSYNVNLVMEKI